MLKRLTLTLAALALLIGTAAAHDMFLIVPDQEVQPNQEIQVALFNGTFDKSENAIDRERMIDVSVVDAAGDVTHPSSDAWMDKDNASWLTVSTGAPGTLLVGISTRTNMIDLTAEEFNDYLKHDGVLDILKQRQEDGTHDQEASERYSKHVKTLLQIGGESTETWKHRLDYPVEFVPLVDPAGLSAGDTMSALTLANGEPLANVLVYASFDGHHGHGDDGTHQEAVKMRTDDQGVMRFEVTHAGRWYLRLIHMVPVDEEGVDYESNWATLTFEVH